MNILKKILCAVASIGALNLAAMEVPAQYKILRKGQTAHNNCCHNCRISLKRLKGEKTPELQRLP